MRVRGVVLGGMCVLLMAGCTVDKTEPPGLTASPTVTVTVTPTAAPTPTSTEVTATDLSDPDGVGIVFVDTPDISGPAASAHDAAAILEKEWWRSSTSGVVSPLIAQLASPEVLEKVSFNVQYNADSGVIFGGILRIELGDVSIDGSSATVDSCSDYTDVEFKYLDGQPTETYDQVGFPQRTLNRIVLTSLDGGVTWRPESYESDVGSC